MIHGELCRKDIKNISIWNCFAFINVFRKRWNLLRINTIKPFYRNINVKRHLLLFYCHHTTFLRNKKKPFSLQYKKGFQDLSFICFSQYNTIFLFKRFLFLVNTQILVFLSEPCSINYSRHWDWWHQNQSFLKFGVPDNLSDLPDNRSGICGFYPKNLCCLWGYQPEYWQHFRYGLQ